MSSILAIRTLAGDVGGVWNYFGFVVPPILGLRLITADRSMCSKADKAIGRSASEVVAVISVFAFFGPGVNFFFPNMSSKVATFLQDQNKGINFPQTNANGNVQRCMQRT